MSFNEYLDYLNQYWSLYPMPEFSNVIENYTDIKL